MALFKALDPAVLAVEGGMSAAIGTPDEYQAIEALHNHPPQPRGRDDVRYLPERLSRLRRADGEWRGDEAAVLNNNIEVGALTPTSNYILGSSKIGRPLKPAVGDEGLEQGMEAVPEDSRLWDSANVTVSIMKIQGLENDALERGLAPVNLPNRPDLSKQIADRISALSKGLSSFWFRGKARPKWQERRRLKAVDRLKRHEAAGRYSPVR